MCGRYTYYSSEEIIKEFDLAPSPDLQLALKFPDNFNVSPGNHMPVIIRGKQEHELAFMEWGLTPSWSSKDNMPLKLINARQEGLFEKPMWRSLVKSKRCVVPAKGFYEWKKVADEKIPYYITLKNDDVLSFAGLWDEWTDGKGNKIKTYTIITTEPNREMSNLHNRMPVILNDQGMDIWLSVGELDKHLVEDLTKPLPDYSLKMIRVSKAVNNSRNNGENLIYEFTE